MQAALVLLFLVGASLVAVLGDRRLNIAVLNAHNRYRAQHGVPPLTLDSRLNNFAQDWANHLAETDTFSHRPNNPYGENLFWSSVYKQTNQDIALTAVEVWYNESQKYDYNTNDGMEGTYHFTQLIWKSSRKLGVGVAKSSKNIVYVACNYDPIGNVQGQFIENVPRPLN
ncbi:hypothetical protein PPYR_06088 [Photinus pyralis]|uniref:SCP domain-containing protein n=2 Tax=Photinus pyralis TaxID=7054 RepID=A0A5N4ASZ6_PHOPY|nr:Golgi-associated plant pathogenesis-related protein 1-like [Photinus pyralis]KAB0800348.1 hypothetical protein PPYR_06088 [Photinus pyralis]